MTSMSGEEIYDNFHKHAIGSAYLQEAQDGARAVAQSFHERATDVQRLIDAVGQGWEGNAADQATTAMTPLAVNFVEGGDDLATLQDLIARQVESFHSAKSKVQPMPPAPQLQDPLIAFTSGQGLDPYLNQLTGYNAAAQNNVDAMTIYHGASDYNTTNLPPVAPQLPGATTPISLKTSGSSTPSGSAGGGVASRPPSVAAGAAGSGTPTARPAMPPAPSMPSQAPQYNPGQTTGQTTTSGTTATSDVPNTGIPVGGSGTTVLPSGEGNLPGAGPVGGGHSGGYSGLALGVGEPLPGGVNGDIRSRLGGGTAGLPGESAPVKNTPTGGGEERPGARSGVGTPGALAEQEKAMLARETAGVRGGPGAAGMLGGPGAHGEADKDHKRKYNYGDDPEELFSGNLPKVAPPTIGETDAEREARYESEQ
jgi:hypothetical protein